MIKKFSHFKKENNFYIDFNGDLNINNRIVRDFNFMLKTISNNKIENFDDFEKISKNKKEILNNADFEISKSMSKKQEKHRFENPETIETFKEIICKIDNFVEFYKKLGITEQKARSLLK